MAHQLLAVIPQTDIEKIHNDLEEMKVLILSLKEGRKAHGDDEEYLTTKEACRRLKVSDRSLFTWRKKGLLHTSRIGRHIYYRGSEIRALIERNRI